MAFRPSVANLQSQSPSDLWREYHEAQLNAFSKLLPGEPFGHLSCGDLLKKASSNSQSLSFEDKAYARKQLRVTIRLRKRMLENYPFKDPNVTNRHVKFIEVLDRIKSCLRQDAPCKLRSTAKDLQANKKAETVNLGPTRLVSGSETQGQPEKSGTRELEPPSYKQPTPDRIKSHETVDEDARCTFLECLSESVDGICNVLDLVAEMKLEASSGTAGMLFTRIIILALFM
jgi:hypothetical protein